MGTETELKLTLPPDAHRHFARHALIAGARKLGSARLQNIYFDTPERALNRRGIALRFRKQGRRWLQTVKCAGEALGGLSRRPEWEQPCVGSGFDFSAIDDAQVRRFLDRSRIRRALEPMFETSFTRQTWLWQPQPGSAVLIAFDRGTIAAAGRVEPISEIELELREGDPGVLLPLALQLAQDLPLKPEAASKAERGFRLWSGAPAAPMRAEPSPLDPNDGAATALRRIALSCQAQMQANEHGVLHSPDPEYIHQMRVGLRRLRSALRVFRPLLNEDRSESLIAGLRHLASVLGAARDWDVVLEEVLDPVLSGCAEHGALPRLREIASQRRDHARAEARALLGQPAYGRTLLELMAVLEGLAPGGADSPQLAEFARERLRRLRRRILRDAEHGADMKIAALHALRVSIKRLRYALEFFAPLYPAKAVRRDLRLMARLQEDLGLLNDLANARTRFDQCAADDAALREAGALITGWHGPRQARLLARLPADLEAFAAARPAWR